MHSFDIVIVGGGMVGLTVACGLQGSGLRIAIVEQNPAPSSEEPSIRVSAINSASEHLLRDLGVWQDIITQRATSYQSMLVWQRDSAGKIQFKANDYGYSHLGHIIENNIIQQALWHKVESCTDITLFSDTGLKQAVWGENEVFITLDNNEILTSRLIAAADGAHSFIRSQANIPVTFRDYGHSALVATIKTEKSHQYSAQQVFYDDGILAFLPLWQDNLCSIVWSLPPEQAEALKIAETTSFEHLLAITFDNRLGQCSLVSERQTIPLTARYARNFAAHRLVLVGDAAHTIHPLAGQGANLGLMDALELILEIKRLHAEGKDIGNYLYLRRYERKRKHSAALMLTAMQSLQSLFDGTSPIKKWLGEQGLNVIDHLPFIKTQFVRQAMGFSENKLN